MRKSALILLLISFFGSMLSLKKGIISDPGNSAPLIIGVEYTFPGMAASLAKTGIKGVKYFPDIYEWGDMQKKDGGAIDFSETDKYVKEYEDAGFTSLVIALQSKSSWGSKDAKGLKPKNISPKPEFENEWEKYVSAVVERYDLDGVDDMPGLKVPVVYYEIGTEFSTYVPESADDYIHTLAISYKAAHDAFADVKILHAAFLTTTAITSKSDSSTYDNDFAAVKQKYGTRILWHSLEDDRKILDHPEIFDVVNFHSCGDVYEIEGIVKWLNWEMKKRGYKKSIFISDTTPTPFIAWGNAVDCTLKPEQMGVVVPPFDEGDRCKITALMKKVLDGDSTSIKWLYSFLATDLVKKCVVAADMHVIQINTSFSEDLALLKMKILKAGAGTSAWAGMLSTKIEPKTNVRTVTGFRPMYYVLIKICMVLEKYESIEKIADADPHVHLYKLKYEFEGTELEHYIAWYDADKIPLPGETIASKTIKIATGGGTDFGITFLDGQMNTDDHNVIYSPVKDGVEVQITNVPIFIN